MVRFRAPQCLSVIEYGALLSYSTRGEGEEARQSQEAMKHLKGDRVVRVQESPSRPNTPPISMCQWIAQYIRQHQSTLPFAGLLTPAATLVPAPKSSLMKPGSLWVPQRLAAALVNAGLGKVVLSCLERATPVEKAALSPPEKRPTAQKHFETLRVVPGLEATSEIVAVDDVVTTGAMLLGSASLLSRAFPNSRIRGFAAMRAMTDPGRFEDIIAPCAGTITFLPATGRTIRSP